MTLEQLKSFVQTQLEVDFDWTLPEIQELSPENLLAWLYEQQKLSFSQLENFLNQSPIETGAFPDESRPGRHQILSQLGQGAMGVVHLAQDRALKRKVAYKQLLGTASGPILRQFLNEVRITAQLEHPAIVPVYQLSIETTTAQELPQLSYSMKLIQGQNLKERLQLQRQHLQETGQPADSLRQLLEIFLKVCDAVSFAHARKIIHRDLKPANIMIGPYGDVYVVDWGIARPIGSLSQSETPGLGSALAMDDQEQTDKDQIVGTPRYLSPQQAAGKNDALDGRSDQFALGLILYEILCLRVAFPASKQIELLRSVLKAELAPMQPFHKRWPIPPELAAIVRKATMRKPAERYAQLGDMAQDIRRYLNYQPVSVYQEPPLSRALRLLRRHGKATFLGVLGLSLVCLLVIAGSLLWQLYNADQARQRQQELSLILSRVADKAQSIDQYLLNIQGQLESLAAGARQALIQGKPGGPLVLKPSGLLPAKAYGQLISLQEPSLELFKTANSQAASELQQLSVLKPQFKAFFEKPELSPEQLREQGLSTREAYIILQSGASMYYPGREARGQAPKGLESWYREASRTKGPVWLQPSPDHLATLMALKDNQGKLLGLAGVDLLLKRLAQEQLPIKELPQLQRILLVNPQAQVCLEMSNLAQASAQQSTQIQVFQPPQTRDLPARLAEEFSLKPTGVLNLPSQQWIYYRLSSLGWYYVLVKNQT